MLQVVILIASCEPVFMSLLSAFAVGHKHFSRQLNRHSVANALSRNTSVHHRHALLNCAGDQKDCWCADASALVREQKAITPQPSDFRPSNAQGPSQDKRQDRSRFFMEKGWDGFEKPGIEVKPGDWVCAECSQHNFARNTDCYKCGASKM